MPLSWEFALPAELAAVEVFRLAEEQAELNPMHPLVDQVKDHGVGRLADVVVVPQAGSGYLPAGTVVSEPGR